MDKIKKLDIKIKLIFLLAVAMIIVFVAISFATNPKSDVQTISTSVEDDSYVAPSTDKEFNKNVESDIKFNDKKINIYVFWGNGCPHCAALANYLLADIPPEYMNYYDVYSFEVWENKDNRTLMQEFADKLNYKASGVPFMIIGNKHLAGYSSGMNDQLLTIIKEQYDKMINNDNYVDTYKQIKGM